VTPLTTHQSTGTSSAQPAKTSRDGDTSRPTPRHSCVETLEQLNGWAAPGRVGQVMLLSPPEHDLPLPEQDPLLQRRLDFLRHTRLQSRVNDPPTDSQQAPALRRPLPVPAAHRTTSITNGNPPNWLLAVMLLPLIDPFESRGVAFCEAKSMLPPPDTE
jgi:hypothetical protein